MKTRIVRSKQKKFGNFRIQNTNHEVHGMKKKISQSTPIVSAKPRFEKKKIIIETPLDFSSEGILYYRPVSEQFLHMYLYLFFFK